MFDWFFDFLGSMGLWNKSAKMLFLGLDNAGKTTLSSVLRGNKMLTVEPTRHPQGTEMKIGNVTYSSFDMGGHEAARRLWSSYFPDMSGIIYLVDASDQIRFAESRQELSRLLSTQQLANVPFLVLGNKIDKADAVSEDVLRDELGLTGLTTGKQGAAEGVRPLELFMCSVTSRSGYANGFKWLNNLI